MSTAKQDIDRLMDSGTAASSINFTPVGGIDPRRRRFAYNPGLWMPVMDTRESGRQTELLPDGLFKVETATLGAENFDINVDPSEYVKQILKDFTAAWFMNNIRTRFEDRGMNELSAITMLDDPERDDKGRIKVAKFHESAQGYYNAIHPSFAELSHECPFGMTVCVTCRLSFLGDEDPSTVHPLIRERMDKLPNQEVAEDLRLQLRAYNLTYQEYCVTLWATIDGELKGRKNGEPGIPKLDESCHHVRMHIHEYAPEDQQALTAAGFGAEVAAGQAASMEKLAEAFREGNKPSVDSDVLARIMERQEQQGELLLAMAKKLTGENETK